MFRLRASLALMLLSTPLAQRAHASEPEWSLATQDTIATIGVRDDAPALLNLHAPGNPWEWVQTPNKIALPARIATAGVPVALHWIYTHAEQDADRHRVTLYFRNASPALTLTSSWAVAAGRGPIEHSMVITNRSGERLTLLAPASLTMPALVLPKDRYVESTQIRRGGSNSQESGGVLTRPVGQYWNANLDSRPSDGGGGDSRAAGVGSQVPFLNFQVDSVHGLYVGWKFSAVGGISGSSDGSTVELSIGLAPDFATDILPGESFLVPAAFIGTYAGGSSEGSYSVYRYVQDGVLPRRPSAQPYPALVYGYYFDGNVPGTQTEADVLASARLAQELGFETFLADAMWFPDTGDWRWDPRRFPHGSRPLADYLHAHGMHFALWMAWTLASDSSAPGALNYTTHPEWFTRPPTFAPDHGINWNAQIDVGNDEARAWVEAATRRVVQDNQVDYLKTDFSPIAITSRAQRAHGDHATAVSYWSTLGYYAIQNRLLETFPQLTLEGCSGGGTIKDHGDIGHVHYIVGTDTLSAMADRQSIYDSSVMFPPSSILLYTYDRIYSDVADAPEPYLWRSGMMGAWDLALTNSATLTAAQKRGIRHATDLYKSWIRPVMQDARVERILPRPDGLHWDGLFYWNAGLHKGTVYIFRPNSERTHENIYLAGLEPGRTYQVHGEDGSVRTGAYSGQSLMDDGIEVRLPAKFTSDLLYVEQTGT